VSAPRKWASAVLLRESELLFGARFFRLHGDSAARMVILHLKAPALPLGGGAYDQSLGVGVPPDSLPKPVSFGFYCFSGNTGGGYFFLFLFLFLIYCCESKKKLNNFLNDGRLPGHVDSAAAAAARPRASVRR